MSWLSYYPFWNSMKLMSLQKIFQSSSMLFSSNLTICFNISVRNCFNDIDNALHHTSIKIVRVIRFRNTIPSRNSVQNVFKLIGSAFIFHKYHLATLGKYQCSICNFHVCKLRHPKDLLPTNRNEHKWRATKKHETVTKWRPESGSRSDGGWRRWH